jgi:plastocyanin
MVRSGQTLRARIRTLRRGRHLAIAALLGASVAVLPAVAASETAPSIVAHNEPGPYGYGAHSWTPSTAEITAGGVVKFSNPSNEVPHGLKFTGGPATPTCTGLPAAATGETGAFNWSGECKFDTPGTYTFICTVHPTEMRGTITVSANGTTTVTTTAPTTSSTTTTPTPPPASEESPLAGPASKALTLKTSQHAGAVRGSLDISKAGAGGRLEISLFAQSAALVKVSRHRPPVRVGKLARSPLSAGKLSFAVPLSSAARKSLKRHRHLTLTVKIVLHPSHGKALTLTRTVVEHA